MAAHTELEAFQRQEHWTLSVGRESWNFFGNKLRVRFCPFCISQNVTVIYGPIFICFVCWSCNTPTIFVISRLSQLFGLSPRELELRKCIIGTPGCMAFCCYLIFPWKKKGEPKRRECYTVYLLDSKILPLCCLLCWTSLNWFMGRETCTKNLISANTNQEGIESILMLKVS